MVEQLSQCPACNSTNSKAFLQAKDWLVSQEVFSLMQCGSCGLVYTNPRPTEESIGRYYQSDAYVSHTNTNKGLINTAYQAVRNRTLRQKRALIETLTGKKGTLLDVGCATGHFLAECKAAGWQTQGTEPDPGARQQANEKGLAVVESVFELNTTGLYDVITLWHVLEHVHRLQETVLRLQQLLKPGGHLLIAVPNRLAADATKYGAGWAAYDVPRHLYHFDPISLQKLIESAGFTLKERKPMVFDAFYVCMLSERNQGGSLLSAFFTGLQSNLKAGKSGQYSSLIHIFVKS
jgi:2-polyprenyl-3-methyl-5-hydroxy-6-metoxy-1,4-benzoquinol methylase